MVSRSRLPLLLVAVTLTMGCFGSKKENSDCAWPAHATVPLNLVRDSDLKHLIADVMAAEELTVRYGDVRWGPGPTRRQRSSQECLEPLFVTIRQQHDVTRSDIEAVRNGLSVRGSNLPTNIPMGVFYLTLTFVVLWFIAKRFSPRDELVPFALGAVLTSPLVGFVTVGVGGMWEMAVEIVRIGNDHLGYRGLRLQWVQYRAELMVAATAVFWIVAAGYAYALATRRTEHPSSKTVG